MGYSVPMSKSARERQVLLGLVDYYIKTGKPVGSNTLKEEGFGKLSAATIRNYFAHLEEQGFLHQQHTSGGRIPTDAALKLYVAHITEEFISQERPLSQGPELDGIEMADLRAVSIFLQRAVESLSLHSGCAVFLSTPCFDRDFVVDLKLVGVDRYRCMCILITDFGALQTEVLYTPFKLSTFTLKRIEGYCHAKLRDTAVPHLPLREKKLAENFYKELMIRYLIGYVNFSQEQLYTTGMARLLSHTEFQDAKVLSSSLALFEDQQGLRRLLQECCRHRHLSYWIGEDLEPFGCQGARCSVMALPYCLNSQTVGAIGLLGPLRMAYREQIDGLYHYATAISEAVTQALYKYKITYRQPKCMSLLGAGTVQLLEEKKESKSRGEREDHGRDRDVTTASQQ